MARLRGSGSDDIETRPWEVELPLQRVVLYRSERGPQGSTYTALYQWDLTETGE